MSTLAVYSAGKRPQAVCRECHQKCGLRHAETHDWHCPVCFERAVRHALSRGRRSQHAGLNATPTVLRVAERILLKEYTEDLREMRIGYGQAPGFQAPRYSKYDQRFKRRRRRAG